MFIKHYNRTIALFVRQLPTVKQQEYKLFEHGQYRFKSIYNKDNAEEMAGVDQTQAEKDGVYRKYLIVGLGNHDMPKSRHSVGMQFVNKIAALLDIKWKREVKTCMGFIATCDISHNTSIILLKPKIPMNVNGTAVARTARCHGIDVSNIYLAHDDTEKKVGKVSIKEKGSASGHNGVKSVMNSMRTDVIPRVRIGVDRPADKNEMVDYVLSDIPREEQIVIDKVIMEGIGQMLKHMTQRGADNCSLGTLINKRNPEDISDVLKSGA